MSYSLREEFRGICSLVLLFAIVLMPFSGIVSAPVQADEAPQMVSAERGVPESGQKTPELVFCGYYGPDGARIQDSRWGEHRVGHLGYDRYLERQKDRLADKPDSFGAAARLLTEPAGRFPYQVQGLRGAGNFDAPKPGSVSGR